jgi:cyclin B
MIDWVLEVLGNYKQTTSHETYFRAVNLMDLFLKKATHRKYTDCDLHLIGITCMFIASKIEDVYHIPLKDFVSRVSHNKFTAFVIKDKEKEILEKIQYQVYFPTYLNYLSHLYFKSLNLNDK